MTMLRSNDKLMRRGSFPRMRVRSDPVVAQTRALLGEVEGLSSSGTFLWRVSTGEIAWSDQLYRIFELSLEVLVTFEAIEARVHPEDRPLLRHAARRAAIRGGVFECQFRVCIPSRPTKLVQLRAHGTRIAAGSLEYFGAVHDVTRLRAAEAALRNDDVELAHVNRIMSLGALTASIAHELKQPLSGVVVNASACLKLLSAERPDLAAAREIVRRTLRDGTRACEMLSRLHALFSRRDTQWESVDLTETARGVVALSMSELLHRRVVLRTELHDGLPTIYGDRVQLQQVIMNLLLNAAEAMSDVHDRPRLAVMRTEAAEGGSVRLSIEDAGRGIEPRGVNRLFQPFYTTKGEGLGIGLFVCRSIIERHGGSLNIESNEGHGVTVSFVVHTKVQSFQG